MRVDIRRMRLTLLLQAVTTVTCVKVAVYEHVVVSHENATSTFKRDEAFAFMLENLSVLRRQASLAAQQGARMLVFPEYGITGFDHNRDSIRPFLEDVPHPSMKWNPCMEPARFPNTSVLQHISCSARQSAIYIVANMGDVKRCDPLTDANCPADGRYQFNTNVVFDDTGKLIARYHKLNMYDETPLFDPAPSNEYVTFETPFGKFGTVVCFDLLNFYPTQELLNKHGVTNLVVTSAWNVFYPFVTPLQMYSGLAKRNHINVIAANVRHGDYIMAGSGIFGPDGEASSSTNFQSAVGELVVSEIYTQVSYKVVKSRPKSFGNAHTLLTRKNTTMSGKYDYGMDMNFEVLEKQSGFSMACYGDVCCALEYRFQIRAPGELYILGVSDYDLQEPGRLHMQFCAVHRCPSAKPDMCGGVVFNTSSTFDYLKLQGYFSPGVVYPFVSASASEGFYFSSERDKYTFDQDRAIIESDTFDKPMLAVVLFNSLYQHHEDDINQSEEPQTGMSSGAAGFMCRPFGWIIIQAALSGCLISLTRCTFNTVNKSHTI